LVQRAFALARAADAFGYDDDDVLAIGSRQWIYALDRAVDDVRGELRTNFEAFLLALAVCDPTPSAETVLRYSFQSLRKKLQTDKATALAERILRGRLCGIPWNSWNLDRRLVKTAGYLFNRASLPSSFKGELRLSYEDEKIFLAGYSEAGQ
jgi:hypothetical protein